MCLLYRSPCMCVNIICICLYCVISGASPGFGGGGGGGNNFFSDLEMRFDRGVRGDAPPIFFLNGAIWCVLVYIF